MYQTVPVFQSNHRKCNHFFITLVWLGNVDQNVAFVYNIVYIGNRKSNLTEKLVQSDAVFKKKSYCEHNFIGQNMFTKINLAARVILQQCTKFNQKENSG